MNSRRLLSAFALLACICIPKPACAIQTQEVDLGRDGVYDGIVRIVRDEHGRMTLCDAETSPVTLNDLRYNGVAHWLLLGLDGDDHPQYLNAVRALTWLATRSTSDLPEGSGLYYTNARARQALSAASPLSYAPATGVISVDAATTATHFGLRLTGLPSGAVPYVTGDGGLAGNTGRLTISSGGNVGIGTAAPASLLQVMGTIATNPGNSGLVRIGSGTGGDVSITGDASTGKMTINAGNQYGGSIDIQRRGISAIWVNGAEGNVGIGTNTPTAKLDVNGAGRVRGTLNVDGVTTTAGINIAGTARLAPSVQSVAANNQALSPSRGFMVLDPTGNRDLNACPAIASGTEGQILVITNKSPDYYVRFSDEALLSGSKLVLGSATRTLDLHDTLTLIYTGDCWCELGFSSKN
ncbi:MAG: hypothetical protein ABFD69_03175 [Candidatus Sumerlaeia bacterium]